MRGIAGIQAYADLKRKGHKELLGLGDGFVLRTWSARDPRLDNPNDIVAHRWFPDFTVDALKNMKWWCQNVPHDYGRESKVKPRPAGYSFFADDGYPFGDYVEFVVDNPLDQTEHGTKKRVRAAYFLNEPDAKAIKNAQGFAESAGVDPRVAAHLMYAINGFWPDLFLIGPCLSQNDPLSGCKWFDAFISELVLITDHSNSSDALERAKPFRRWFRIAFQWYPKGFHLMNESQEHMCSIDYPITQLHAVMDKHGLMAGHRKMAWVTEAASPPAYVGPDYPAPPGDYADWGPKEQWPGTQRWQEWVNDMSSHPYIEEWLAFTASHAQPDKQRFVLIDKNGALTPAGDIFRKAPQ